MVRIDSHLPDCNHQPHATRGKVYVNVHIQDNPEYYLESILLPDS